jgi:hypothetical protein
MAPIRLGKFSCALQAICVTPEISRDAASTGQLDRGNVFDKLCSEIFDASLDKRDRTKLPTFARSGSPGIEKRWSGTSPVDVGRVQLVRNFNVVGFENFGFRYVRLHVPVCEASVRLSQRKYRTLLGPPERCESLSGQWHQ